MEATLEENSEVGATVWEVELTGVHIFEPHCFIASASLRGLSTVISKCGLARLAVDDHGKVEIPVFAVLGCPESHVLSVIKWEVDPDVLSAVESAGAHSLLVDPVLEGLSHQLESEGIVLYRCGTHSVDHTISIACRVASEVAFLVVCFTTVSIIGAARAIPVAIMPCWVLAAGVGPVAVVVERVISSAKISISLSISLIAVKPVLERLDIRSHDDLFHAIISSAWN